MKKKGRNSVTVDELVHVITPKGRGINCFTDLLPFCILACDGNLVEAPRQDKAIHGILHFLCL